MSINTRESYIEIGTSVNLDNTLNDVLMLPVPNELPSSNQFLADAGRNANGTMMIQQIGRTQYTTSIRWATLPSKKWWEINRWFDEHGYAFWMKYFSHTDGRIKIQQFYRGNVEEGVPTGNTVMMKGYAVPASYKGCGFNVIDIGDENVIILEEMDVV